MGKILELPTHISNQIKAGEIVERPMSVVKELVENAIDANSTQIDVIIEEGGLSKIQVIDNGDGMESDDTVVAFKRHATSKMTKLIEQSTILSPDKMPISTLGFRGEALSSIASVSKVTLETSTGLHEGTYVYLEGGQVIEQRASTARKGTSLTVEQLFFNTPARLKFISSLQTEVSKIADLLNRLALSHPNIAFSLTVDGNRLLKTVGNGQLKQTIAGIYNPSVAKQMIAINAENLRFKVSGFTSLPELTRAKKNFISIFLNGRYIRNFLLINAVVDGYRSKLMIGRFPVSVLNIETDYRLVDVNAHPTKETVRISQEQELIQLIQQAISQAMDDNVRIPSSVPKRFEKTMVQDSLSFVKEDFATEQNENVIRVDMTSEMFHFDDNQVVTNHIDNDQIVTNYKRSVQDDNEEIAYNDSVFETPNNTHPIEDTTITAPQPVSVVKEELHKTPQFPQLHYFGQMHGTYLFAENENGLYIVDQHAAQERIKYEYYRVKIGEVDGATQQLLVPIVLDYPNNEFLLVKEKMALLADVGIHLSLFGQNSFVIEEHPTWIKDDVELVVRDLIQMALDTNKVDIAKYREQLAVMMSCKKSIKANHYLDDKQARQLLLDLSLCENPYNCPHGRPVLIHLNNNDIEKMFKRIQERY